MSDVTVSNLCFVLIVFMIGMFIVSCAPAPKMDWAALVDGIEEVQNKPDQKQPAQKQAPKKGSN